MHSTGGSTQPSQPQQRLPRRLPSSMGGTTGDLLPAAASTSFPQQKTSAQAAAPAQQAAVLMDSDEEDWEAVDLLVANRQQAQRASQPAGPEQGPLRSVANCLRVVKPAAPRMAAKDGPQLPEPLCRHGRPMASCARRAEHLAEIKESLLSLMTRLLDEPEMPPEDQARLMAERRRLQAEQALLEAAPPLAVTAAQRGEGAGAPLLPATPAHGHHQASAPSAVLRKQSLSQTSQPAAQPTGAVRAGDAYGHGGFHSTAASSGPAGGPQGSCHSCGEAGHWARDCPRKQGSVGPGRTQGPLPGTCHSCGEAGHWASSCPQRGAGAGPGLGSIGGGSATGGFAAGVDGFEGGFGGEFRPPDPALRGGSDAAETGSAGQCRWQEGTNEPQWSRRFPWTPVRSPNHCSQLSSATHPVHNKPHLRPQRGCQCFAGHDAAGARGQMLCTSRGPS